MAQRKLPCDNQSRPNFVGPPTVAELQQLCKFQQAGEHHILLSNAQANKTGSYTKADTNPRRTKPIEKREENQWKTLNLEGKFFEDLNGRTHC